VIGRKDDQQLLRDNKVSHSNDAAKSNSTNNHNYNKPYHRQKTNLNNEEKQQVVSSRWSVSSTSKSSAWSIQDRHEHRHQAIHAVTQQQQQQRLCRLRTTRTTNVHNAQSHSGVKRSHHLGNFHHGQHKNAGSRTTENDSLKTLQPPLPQIGDTLAVNLLRLLEGAAAIRLHHRQHQEQRLLPSHGSNREYMLERVASMAAAQVLAEIRFSIASPATSNEMILPLHVEDAAMFYYNEKMSRAAYGSIHSRHRTSRREAEGECGSGPCIFLGPGAKMMLRMHLFDLMNKLSMYEQT